VKGTAPIRVIFFLLSAACGALCQNLASADLLHGSQPDAPNPPEVQRPETRSWQSLPDAPLPVQPQAPENGSSVMRVDAVSVTPPPQFSFPAPDALRFTQDKSSDFFSRNLVFQLPKPDPSYAHSTSGSFLGRASYAASSVLFIHTPSGRPRLNTGYFLGILALAAVHTAYRPYWERTGSAVAGDFGVSIGSNAGINVFHEFEPAIRGITPKFVFRLGERLTGGQAPRDSLSTPER
jgi:hypothetical protein